MVFVTFSASCWHRPAQGTHPRIVAVSPPCSRNNADADSKILAAVASVLEFIIEHVQFQCGPAFANCQQFSERVQKMACDRHGQGIVSSKDDAVPGSMTKTTKRCREVRAA